jgi:D-alanine-D-alanine ligase
MTLLQPDDTSTVADYSLTDEQPRRSNRVDELESQIAQLMTRMRIAVVYGGDKTAEGAVINQTCNPRSWKSYQAVAEDIAGALGRIGFRHVHLMPEDMQLGSRLAESGIHMAWLNTGGVQGYNPMAHAAAMLEMCGIPYVGHDPLAAGMLDNKHVFKRELQALGIPNAPFVLSHYGSGRFRPEADIRFKRTFGDYGGPFVVKPVSGRASLHVHLVDRTSDLCDAVAEVHHTTENHVLIEKFLPGREFCIAACGPVTAQGGRLQRHKQPFVFAAVERVLAPNERIFTSMDVRPITSDRVRRLDPVSDARHLSTLQMLARKVYRELNLEALIRLDVRIDSEGVMEILESNPKPDLKLPTRERLSLVCASLAAHGMSYDDLILSLIADRIDLLFSQRRRAVTHLTALLDRT